MAEPPNSKKTKTVADFYKNNPCRLHWMRKTMYLGQSISETLELDEECLHKSLYVCTSEQGVAYPSYNIRAIKLSHLLENKNQLHQVAYDYGSHLPAFAACGVFGSEIVFAGGSRILEYGALERSCSKDLYVFDTKPQSQAFTKMDTSFRQGKHRPLLVQLGGKRYALSGKPIFEPAPANPAFEVFDPLLKNWTPLAEPPFLDFDGPGFKFAPFSYIISGSKIYVSSREVRVRKKCMPGIRRVPLGERMRHIAMIINEQQANEEGDEVVEEDADEEEDELIEEVEEEVEQLLTKEEGNCDVYCFDVAKADVGWRKISNFFWKQQGRAPFDTTPFHGRALSVDFNLDGDLKLVFTYVFDGQIKPQNEIYVFLMSNSEERAMLLCCLEFHLPVEFREPTEYNFVQLGDRKIGLILSRFSRSNQDRNDTAFVKYASGKMNVVLVPLAFEYWDDWYWNFRFKFMPYRVLEYYTREDSSNYPEVLGCFVL